MRKKALSKIIVSLLLLFSTGCDKELPSTVEGVNKTDISSLKRPEVYPIPFKTMGDYFGVYDGKEYKKIFVKGMNLAVAFPGTRAGELEVSHEQYLAWFKRMGEIGINTLRIYTLHRPPFYDALLEYNLTHKDKPLYVLHGIWFDEDEHEWDMFVRSPGFKDGIREVIDASHGKAEIGKRFGRAYGTYKSDISPWIMGWLVGREILFEEVQATNQNHPDKTTFNGNYVKIKNAEPGEAWATEHLDFTLNYEKDRYKVTRPVGLSSWPTLDPIKHPTEPSRKPEDIVSVDVTKIDYKNAPAGLFASYHVYPYYPDFIIDDPTYRQASDEFGENSYLGYIRELKNHYKGMPLLIAEFGITESWGMGHLASNSMHHGTHDEEEQGKYNVRLLKNIYDTKMAGAVLFVWIDEWWKSTWVVAPLNFPRDRFQLWHNVVSPEQNYGLIAFDPVTPPFSTMAVKTKSGERLAEVKGVADAEFFHLDIRLNSPLAAGEVMHIGYDTYRDDLGESVLPNKVKTGRRNEFALKITGGARQAELMVTESYDLLGILNPSTPARNKFRSTATDNAPWNLIRWRVNTDYESDDKLYSFEEKFYDTGILRARKAGDKETSLDAVVVDNNNIRVRIPWTYLNFTDPSSRSVMHDDRGTQAREAVVSEGIAVSLSLGGDLLETERYTWNTWDTAPPYKQVEKKSMAIYESALKSLPEIR